VRTLREVIGYSDFYDFYSEMQVVGNGKFGLVKLIKHKQTNQLLAVKILKKGEMTNKDLEL
jgi:serine/threonine protein kinase